MSKRPLKLTIDRRWPKPSYTVGVLLVGDSRFCETLEDTVRPIGQKIPGKTAIPAGTYVVNMSTVSPKFRSKNWAKLYNGVVPRLQDVPGFSGVLLHPGNSADDTEGCILVGRNRAVGKVLDSQATYRRLMDEVLMPAAVAGQKIIITIQ